jgi:hypothetical protein
MPSDAVLPTQNKGGSPFLLAFTPSSLTSFFDFNITC